MRKKYLSIILGSIMALSLVGCGGPSKEEYNVLNNKVSEYETKIKEYEDTITTLETSIKEKDETKIVLMKIRINFKKK